MHTQVPLRRILLIFSALLCTLFYSGCTTEGVRVTGQSADSPDAAFSQSETSIAVASADGRTNIVVAYNDETDTAQTIMESQNDRFVLPGANHMGWSYSLDSGKTWKYGGKVAVPPGLNGLWGDPAVCASGVSPSIVYMSSVAMPASKLTSAGFHGDAENFVAGACIAKSFDGGRTFHPFQVLDDRSHFYDGSSLASSPTGETYAAYLDDRDDQTVVWRSKNDFSQFQLLGRPFPNLRITTHPRLRVDQTSGVLYVAAMASDDRVYLSSWFQTGFTAPIAATETLAPDAGPAGPAYPTIAFASGKKYRVAAQFSFDVGRGSRSDVDSIRMLYTRRDPSGRLYLSGSYGPRTLAFFDQAPEWGTSGLTGDQFNPLVKAWTSGPGETTVWKTSFYQRDTSGGDNLSVYQGDMLYNGPTRIYLPLPLVSQIPVCPDLRGYWGDYDDLAVIGVQSGSPVFIRAMSDSALGCIKEWFYTSQHLHVRAATFQ